MKSPHAPVIEVDADRCVNCHQCIAVCPVKFCNDASGDFVDLNTNECIGCGQCVSACVHEARRPLDDRDEFEQAVRAGRPMVAIVAPAIAAIFGGDFLRVNGWLKSLGVKAVFDVSFGAEVTVRSYVEHLTKDQPSCVITQPCPAIVNYIEMYKPELLPHLAPVDSPMAHTIRAI